MTFHSSIEEIPTKLMPTYENGRLYKVFVEPRYYQLNDGSCEKFDTPYDAADWFKDVTIGELVEDGHVEFKDSIVGVYDDGEVVTVGEVSWSK